MHCACVIYVQYIDILVYGSIYSNKTHVHTSHIASLNSESHHSPEASPGLCPLQNHKLMLSAWRWQAVMKAVKSVIPSWYIYPTFRKMRVSEDCESHTFPKIIRPAQYTTRSWIPFLGKAGCRRSCMYMLGIYLRPRTMVR